MNANLIPTQADTQISVCLEKPQSFAVVAGAGSGKTTSLVEALKQIRERRGKELRQAGQRIVCITYTNRAVDVISLRLKFDDLFPFPHCMDFYGVKFLDFRATFGRL